MSDTGHAHVADEPHADSHDHAHGGLAKYYVVFFALCALTTCSFFTYSTWFREHFDPKVGWALMMAVSCMKALLVILFFMHVKYEANWKYVLTIPAGLMSIFLILMLVPDIGNRNKVDAWGTSSTERRLHMADPREAEHKEGAKDGASESRHEPS